MSASIKENTYSPGSNRFTRTMSITSGKGGVGKTTIVCNLAMALSRQGKNVLILDGDLGMANVDIMFGTRCKYSIKDILNGTRRIEEVITQIEPNIWVLP